MKRYFCEVEHFKKRTTTADKALYFVGAIGIVVALLASYFHWELI